MTKQPKVSVVIPMYNAEKYIAETIKSIMQQSYKNLEIIIVDNCSNDNSRQIVENMHHNCIKLIKLGHNSGGPARPRNIGVKHANGDYLAFLDADDLWISNKLEKQLIFMQKNNLNFSSHNAITIDENSNIINKINFVKKYLKKIQNYNIEKLVRGNFIYLSSVILKKDLFSEFNEENECISVEDYFLWLQLFNNKNVRYGFLAKELLKYRIVENSVSDRKIAGKQKAKAMYYCLKFILQSGRFDLIKQIKG